MTDPKSDLSEISKLRRSIKQLEGILRTSSNPDQRRRVSKDLARYKERLEEALENNIEGESAMGGGVDGEAGNEGSKGSGGQADENAYQVLNKFNYEPASPHCEDNDVNIVATVLAIFEKEYWPALAEGHMKLDFSHSSERDSFYTRLEESKRNLKILLETIEEYATVTKADFREQLYKMKNKQTRIFLFEAITMFQKIHDFLEKIFKDHRAGGNILLNPEDEIVFNPNFESATLLNHYTLPKALEEAIVLCQELIDEINLPVDFREGF